MKRRPRGVPTVSSTISDPPLEKAKTLIAGLDEITGGGLPRGRPTLICGSAGSGKTLLAMEFLVRGARELGEPGVFVAFEETATELRTNVSSLGFGVGELMAQKKLAVQYIHVEASEIEEAGEYDLEGLFIQLGCLIDSVKAKRIVLDTIESLFGGFTNEAILRAELRRLFRWLKDRGLTAVITAEEGQGTLTKHGLEEYVSDAVIVLDHRVDRQIATRRLRIVKYRGSLHGTNEYPFLIEKTGVSILPVTSLKLNYPVSSKLVSSGIPRLDALLGGGYYQGTSVMVSGSAGTGKTSLAAHFVDWSCRQKKRCVYLAFEESVAQIIRNMKSIGLDLGKWVDKGLLRIDASRPTLHGLEMHLVNTRNLVNDFRPEAVVFDPINNLVVVGDAVEVKGMLTRLIDYLKNVGATTIFTNLTRDIVSAEEIGISSLMDTWIHIDSVQADAERTRTIEILKSRGMNHSNQVREMTISDDGVALVDVYVGEGATYTGARRLAQEARDHHAAREREQEIERRKRRFERNRAVLQAKMAQLKSTLENEEHDLRKLLREEESDRRTTSQFESEVSKVRRSDQNHVKTRSKGREGPENAGK